MTFLSALILIAIFTMSVLLREKIARVFHWTKLPHWLTYLIVSIPYIYIEEQINCESTWCYTKLIPPTFFLVFGCVCILLIAVKIFRTTRVYTPLLIFCITGMLFELTVGFSHYVLQAFLVSNPLFFAIIFIWVGFSYVFVAYIPLVVLQYKPTI